MLGPGAIALVVALPSSARAGSSGAIGDFTPVCIGSALTFPAETTGADARDAAQNPGHAYGDLNSAPNPAWFYFKIKDGGALNLAQTNSANADVDGALWGPFDDVPDFVRDGQSPETSYEPAVLLDSDYDAAPGFDFTADVDSGKYYVLLVSNFSTTATDISLDSGTGTTATSDCDAVEPGFDVTPADADLGVGETETTAVENGATDSYTLSLFRAPSAPVTVDISVADGEVAVSPVQVTFTDQDWYVTRTITVRAVDDDVPDGRRPDTISNTASSADARYDGLVRTVTSEALDDDDADLDGDGIPRSVEGGRSSDADGTPDDRDTDSDGDGIDDAVEAGPDPTNPVDSDGDGVPDYRDVDSDNDGVSDAVEGGSADADGDGTPDYVDPDRDSDGDGTLDADDTDDDGDGIADADEQRRIDFTDLEFVLDGSARDSDQLGTLARDEFLLTPDEPSRAGTLTSAQRIDLSGPFRFAFDIHAGADDDGADGLAFFFHDDPAGAAATGASGRGLGAEGIENGLGIEFDTHFNVSLSDVINDHTSFFDTEDMAPLTPVVDLGDIEDGAYHAVVVTWNPATDTIDYAIDGTSRGTLTEDIVATRFGGSDHVRFGLSASTGGLTNEHKVIFREFEGTLVGTDDTAPDEFDTDGDGIPNRLDTDSDNDGLPDADERGDGADATDADADGTPDYLDDDSDNDGVPDVQEGDGDLDGDGIPNHRDTDSDGDGTPDGAEDLDADGVLDADDTDADGDGIPDVEEGGADLDGDGLSNARDADADGDGIPDADEGTVDSDGDGAPDHLDTDSDGDGVSDAAEGAGDADRDGIGDYADFDADNDGANDDVDIDRDNDGILDVDEAAFAPPPEDPRFAAALPGDLDGDGVPNAFDLDSDDDGIPDNVEAQPTTGYRAPSGTAGAGVVDSNGDGLDDVYDDSTPTGAAAGFVGKGLAGVDTDGDGYLDHHDDDSDADGRPDLAESGIADAGTGTLDTDGDGLLDRFEGADADDRRDVSDGIDDPAADLGNELGDTVEVAYREVIRVPTVAALSTNDATPTLTGTHSSGAPLTVTLAGTTYRTSDAGPELVDGGDDTWTLEVATPIADGTYDVVATSSSLDGAVVRTDAGADELALDTTPPVPTLALDPIAADDVLNAAEVGAGVTVTGTASGEFVDGDAVTLTVGDVDYATTVDAAGAFSVYVDGEDLAGAASVSVSVATQDGFGNAGTGATSAAYAVDVDAPVPTIGIDPIAADDVINAAEAAGTIAVTGTVTGEFAIGDPVTLTVDGTDYVGAVAAGAGATGAFSIDVPGDVLAAAAGTPVRVAVDTVDAAGNPGGGTASRDHAADTLVPVPTLAIDPVTADDVINAAEAEAPVSVSGRVGGDGAVGDIVTLAVGDTDYLATVTASLDWSVDVPGSALVGAATANAAELRAVTANTDAAGNVGTVVATRPYAIDTIAARVTIAVTGVTPDNTLNAAESRTSVVVTGTVTGEITEADPVTITVDGQDFTGGIDAGGAFGVVVPGEVLANAAALLASVTSVDRAGNPGTGSTPHDYLVDVAAPTLDIALDVVTADNVVNLVESIAPIALSGRVVGQFAEGDEVTLSIGGESIPATVDASGAFSATVPGALLRGNGAVDVRVETEDAAGNPARASATRDYAVDVDAPGVSGVIVGAGSGETIELAGTSDGPEGLEVVVVDRDGTEICSARIDAEGRWSCPIANPAGGADSVGLVATVIDPAGNAATGPIGVTDAFDADADGIPDSVEGTSDADGDGIPDALEGTGDTDGDGVPDERDLDSDNDGIPDALEGVRDSDGDGTPNARDIDSDGDGIHDAVENGIPAGADADGDGRLDGPFGANGLADVLETTPDSGLIDADGDGASDAPRDSDGDGTSDATDSDSDGDGIADADELAGADTDGDGVLDGRDLDSDNDGIPDAIEGAGDSDGDGIPDARDVDSDNDGLYDRLENGTLGGSDADGDGRLDGPFGANGLADVLETTPDSGLIDADGDGAPDAPRDSDGDGTSDATDSDSDGDGIADAIEAGGDDADRDGARDGFVDSDGDGADDVTSIVGVDDPDSDGDGTPDRIDTDSDGDGIADADELAGADTDGDGIPDAIEGGRDSDRDGVPDERDLDSDNDGITDAVEGDVVERTVGGRAAGTNGPFADGADPDAVPDTDGDGVPDYRDRDSDNDGLTDAFESQGLAADGDGDGIVDDFVDDDGDGQDDARAVVPVVPDDVDGDGVPDHLDLDTDGDGTLDAVEGGRDDGNADGVTDRMKDDDGDGVPNVADADHTGGPDVDGDGIDDTADADFVGGGDADGDGIVDPRDPDADGDGLVDPFDDGAGGIGFAAIPDSDGDGVPDVEQTDAQLGAASPAGRYRTGLQGGGCSIGDVSARGPLDPALPALAGIAVLWLWRRRRATPATGAGTPDRFGDGHASRRAGSNVAPVACALAVTAALGAGLPGPAAAQASDAGGFERRFYAGLGLGRSGLDPDTGAVPGVRVDDGAAAGVQLALGTDLNERFSIELHAARLGEAGLSSGESIGYSQVGVSALGYVGRARDRAGRRGVIGFGRVGLGVLANDDSNTDAGVDKDNAVHVLFGAGVEYATRSGLALRAEGIAFDADASLLQLGLVYRFGGSERRPGIDSMATDEPGRAVEPVVGPVVEEAVEEAAEPVLEAASPPSDDADIGTIEGPTFPSGSSELTEAARLRLDEVAGTLRELPGRRFVVSAHTDNRGREVENLILSRDRAERVARYLAASGIDEERIEVRAHGERRPIASNDTEEGRGRNRRVELDVVR